MHHCLILSVNGALQIVSDDDDDNENNDERSYKINDNGIWYALNTQPVAYESDAEKTVSQESTGVNATGVCPPQYLTSRGPSMSYTITRMTVRCNIFVN